MAMLSGCKPGGSKWEMNQKHNSSADDTAEEFFRRWFFRRWSLLARVPWFDLDLSCERKANS